MYTALYRAQRPEVFSEIIGQEHIVRILKNQIETGTVSHAYLFCGTRGTGKTTIARILAKAVNCLGDGEHPCGQCENCKAIKDGTFMDVIEIDAASNNGVDNIRELRESVKYPPAVGRKKVYIIDEVHMLSPGAANALLKTLEEPPENVMFILATTDPQRLPQTILSRCMRLDFKRVSERALIDHMARICREKGVQVTDPALRLLAANADGSVRDGLSILDQCLAGGDKTLDRDTILEFLGTVSEEFFLKLTDRVLLHDVAGALILLDGALEEGKDVKQLMKDWMSHYRNLLITKYIKNAEDMLNMSSENIQMIEDQSNQISLDEINHGIITLSKTIVDAKYSPQPRILLEIAIVTIAAGIGETQVGVSSKQATLQPRMQSSPKATRPTAAKPASQEGIRDTGTSTSHEVKTGSSKGSESDIAEAEAFDRSYDLEEIWEQVAAEGERTVLPSFNMVRIGSVLADINDHEFKVIAQNEFTKNYIETNQMQICDLMEKIIGKRLRLVCKVEGQAEDDVESQRAHALAKEVGAFLNMEVKVE